MTASSPLLALRAALLTYLAGDAALVALMGGRLRLYDELPRGVAPVYALFGPSEVSDDSVDGARCRLTDKSLYSQTSMSQFSEKLVRANPHTARPRVDPGLIDSRNRVLPAGLLEGGQACGVVVP